MSDLENCPSLPVMGTAVSHSCLPCFPPEVALPVARPEHIGSDRGTQRGGHAAIVSDGCDVEREEREAGQAAGTPRGTSLPTVTPSISLR